MKRYCETCKTLHDENELCPKYKEQLKQHPEWVAEATKMANLACQQHLLKSQAINNLANQINKLTGSNLSFEGTDQYVRDIRVFAKLNSDSFRNSGQFANAEIAKQTFENSSDGFKRYLQGRLNGTGQEIDWLIKGEGKLDNLLYKYQLPDGNTVGFDGVKINRFTGKTVERITIKAAEGNSGLHTNAKDIVEALEKGTLTPKDSVFGTEGLKDNVLKALDKRIASAEVEGNTQLVETLKKAKNMKINENGNFQSTQDSTKRLVNKIQDGNANTQITASGTVSKMAQGAVIGAAVSLTVSGITNYIKYKNGELTKEETFREIGEDTAKGALVGGAMSGVNVLLAAAGCTGPIGFAVGMTIGVYVNAVVGNLLDEIFGKGFYNELLNAEGYILGTTKNISEALQEFKESAERTDIANKNSQQTIERITVQQSAIKNKREKVKNLWEEL